MSKEKIKVAVQMDKLNKINKYTDSTLALIKEAIKRIEKRENRRLLSREKKGLRKAKLLYEKHSKEMKIINSNQAIEKVSSDIEQLVSNVI